MSKEFKLGEKCFFFDCEQNETLDIIIILIVGIIVSEPFIAVDAEKYNILDIARKTEYSVYSDSIYKSVAEMKDKMPPEMQKKKINSGVILHIIRAKEENRKTLDKKTEEYLEERSKYEANNNFFEGLIKDLKEVICERNKKNT